MQLNCIFYDKNDVELDRFSVEGFVEKMLDPYSTTLVCDLGVPAVITDNTLTQFAHIHQYSGNIHKIIFLDDNDVILANYMGYNYIHSISVGFEGGNINNKKLTYVMIFNKEIVDPTQGGITPQTVNVPTTKK